MTDDKADARRNLLLAADALIDEASALVETLQGQGAIPPIPGHSDLAELIRRLAVHVQRLTVEVCGEG
jgi:hypothetical protein